MILLPPIRCIASTCINHVCKSIMCASSTMILLPPFVAYHQSCVQVQQWYILLPPICCVPSTICVSSTMILLPTICCVASTMCANSCKFNDDITPPHLLRSISHVCKLNDDIAPKHIPTPCGAYNGSCVQVNRSRSCVTSNISVTARNAIISQTPTSPTRESGATPPLLSYKFFRPTSTRPPPWKRRMSPHPAMEVPGGTVTPFCWHKQAIEVGLIDKFSWVLVKNLWNKTTIGLVLFWPWKLNYLFINIKYVYIYIV